MAVTCPECSTDAWQHPAGLCLDKWVAKVIFGKEPCALWQQRNMGSAGGPVYVKHCQHEEGRCYPATPIRTLHGIVGGPPRYSTEMAFAWQVIERLAAEGACPGLINDDCGHWALSLEGMQSVVRGPEPADVETSFLVYAYRWADTALLAICRAVAADYAQDPQP